MNHPHPSTQPLPLVYRGVSGKEDYPLLLEINRSSRQADHDPEPITLAQIAEGCAPSA